MLELFNANVAMILAFGLLLLMLVGPFLLVWIALSIRRDIRRIADIKEHMSNRFDMVTHDAVTGQTKQLDPPSTHIANSAFGR